MYTMSNSATSSLRPLWRRCFLFLALCSLSLALVHSISTKNLRRRPAFVVPRTCEGRRTAAATAAPLQRSLAMRQVCCAARTLPTRPESVLFWPAQSLWQKREKGHQNRRILDNWSPLWASSSSQNSSDDEDGSSSSSTSGGEDTAKGPPRIRAKFDRLFAGMPSMQDILRGRLANDDDSDDDDLSLLAAPPRPPKKKKRDVDDSWFQTEQQLIRANYDRILDDMLVQLAEERRRDPEAIPDNAEALIRSVLKQEMEREISQTRNHRMEEMMSTYELEQREANDAISELPPPPESVQKLMQESEAEFQQQEASRLEIEDFLRYEQEAVLKSNTVVAEELESGIRRPGPNEDLDQWALDRLKEMAGAREDSDGDEMILDILQDNVQDLEDRIRKETVRTGSMLPETMKEWQMYRAIATRLTRGFKGGTEEEASREEEILMQLESWKDYIQKEEGIRRQSGLARGPRMPFAWQEQDLLEREIPSPGASDKQSRINTRKQLNRMSIEALESLLSTTDLARRERLQKEIDFLKATLEENDYLDVEESYLEDTTSTMPIDVSGLFQTSPKDDDNLEDSPSSFIKSFDTSVQSSGAGPKYSFSFSSDDNPVATPPDTPYFEEELEDTPARTVPPPNTAFFADFDDSEPDLGETLTGDSKLGTMEDQKLEAMYRRAGARTTEERAVIRKQWEDFQAFEKTRRDQSGLSGRMDDDAATAAKFLNYNISNVVREDGDIDAEAILAAIGPRPSRTKKSDTADPSLGKKDVMNSLYRAVEAVGGGRYRDDPDAKAKQQASFEEYMEKEAAMRESLDDPHLADSVTLPSGEEIDMDDPEYAEEVLSALGSRPKPRKARKIDPGDYSDKGGILSSDVFDDVSDGSEDASDDDDDETETKDSGEDSLMPEWLRKEKKDAIKKESGGIRRRGSFLGSEIDQVFDDTDYEHNMRQLAEYEKRRAGRGRQMGIDISDVLGRSTFDTDDYADYKYEDASGRKGADWGTSSFASRKANLLEYIELDVMELNSLMDHKSSVYSTGVSQYLPRINKPFSAFGAIFRMEGVLLNVDGLQLKAWTKVANQYGFKAPTLDEVQQASVTRPEVAVKDIFFWTEDFLECRDVAFSHKQAFKEVFKAWTDENGITMPEVSDVQNGRGSLAIGAVSQSSPQPTYRRPANEDEKFDLVSKAWAATAEAFGKNPPRREEIVVAASLSPDIAVRQAFGWAVDPLEVDSIVYMYRRYLRAESGQIDEPRTTPAPSPPAATPSTKRPLTQTDVMEMHYHAWKAVAESFGFQAPSSEEVLAAFVINEPEAAAQGFGWSDDPPILRDIGAAFLQKLAELKRGGGATEPVPKPATSTRTTSSSSDDSGPSQDEIFQVSFEAWRATARKNGFRDPDAEEVQFALTVGPDEAILTGFRWTSYPSEAARLVESYKSELAQRRPSWLTKDSSSSSRSQSRTAMSESSRTTSGGPSADELYLAVFNAWTDTARKLGFPLPDDEQVVFAMSVGAEEAVVTGFGWTNDRAKAREIVESYKVELSKRRSSWVKRGVMSDGSAKSSGSTNDVPMVQVHPGAAKWVKSLLDVEMECGVVSYLERDQVNALLQHAGLDGLISPDKRVSTSNGYATDKDQLLGAALRLERRPDHCVVFDSTPYASIAAHDVGMQSVSLIGPYPRYELLSADTTSSSFEDLTAMNIRRLFSERVYDQPLVESAQSQPEKRAITKTRFFYDDD